MIDVIPAKPWMARKLQLQTVQILNGATMTPDAIDMALEGGMALAATDGTRLLGMAGIYERWEDVGLAWALLAEDFADHRVSVFKLMKQALDVTPFRRVEAYVVDGHEAGFRLLAHLGFEEEGVMRKFWQGRDHRLFAKVKG